MEIKIELVTEKKVYFILRNMFTSGPVIDGILAQIKGLIINSDEYNILEYFVQREINQVNIRKTLISHKENVS